MRRCVRLVGETLSIVSGIKRTYPQGVRVQGQACCAFTQEGGMHSSRRVRQQHPESDVRVHALLCEAQLGHASATTGSGPCQVLSALLLRTQ